MDCALINQFAIHFWFSKKKFWLKTSWRIALYRWTLCDYPTLNMITSKKLSLFRRHFVFHWPYGLALQSNILSNYHWNFKFIWLVVRWCWCISTMQLQSHELFYIHCILYRYMYQVYYTCVKYTYSIY